MAARSFIRYLALAALCQVAFSIPQAPLEQAQSATFLSGAAPAQESPTGDVAQCGGCELVADVAGLVWYSQVFVNTAGTEVVGVGVNNGTRATQTSFVQNEGEFTYNPGSSANGGALTQVNFDSSITIAGAVLTSPTAYNVFTGYTIRSAFSDQGRCVTTTEVSTLSTAYSETLPSASGRVYLDVNGQQEFISFLGFSTCSGGGENVSPTALLQVMNTTATSTTTFSGVSAEQSLSISLASATTPISVSASTTKNATFPSASAPEIVLGNVTITPSSNPIGLPVYNGTTVTGGTGYPGPTASSSISPFTGAGNANMMPSGWLLASIGGFVGFGAGIYYL